MQVRPRFRYGGAGRSTVPGNGWERSGNGSSGTRAALTATRPSRCPDDRRLSQPLDIRHRFRPTVARSRSGARGRACDIVTARWHGHLSVDRRRIKFHTDNQQDERWVLRTHRPLVLLPWATGHPLSSSSVLLPWAVEIAAGQRWFSTGRRVRPVTCRNVRFQEDESGVLLTVRRPLEIRPKRTP